VSYRKSPSDPNKFFYYFKHTYDYPIYVFLLINASSSGGSVIGVFMPNEVVSGGGMHGFGNVLEEELRCIVIGRSDTKEEIERLKRTVCSGTENRPGTKSGSAAGGGSGASIPKELDFTKTVKNTYFVLERPVNVVPDETARKGGRGEWSAEQNLEFKKGTASSGEVYDITFRNKWHGVLDMQYQVRNIGTTSADFWVVVVMRDNAGKFTTRPKSFGLARGYEKTEYIKSRTSAGFSLVKVVACADYETCRKLADEEAKR
jgi:hypothetical protein